MVSLNAVNVKHTDKSSPVGIAERKLRHKDALRRQILDAARDLLSTKGFAKFSMRNIAERIEYSPTTIYLYFKNQEELVHALCEEVYGELADVLERAGRTAGNPLARLRAALRAYINFGLADPTRYRVAFMTKVAPHIDASSFLDQGPQARRGANTMRQLVSAVLRKPEPQAVEATLQALWALVHGVVALLVEHPRFPWVARDRLIARSLELIINGIGEETRRPPARPSRAGGKRAAGGNGASRAREGGAQ